MTRGRSRVAVVVDVDAASTLPVAELHEAVAQRVLPELVEWSEVGDHTGHDVDGVPDTGDRAAARAVSLGVPTVVACGDDVTVRRCLEAVAGAATALGIVSLGQGSLLAANLGMPPGLDALQYALDGEIRRVDVGEVDGELFGVHAGFGVDVLAGRRRGEEPFRPADLLRGLRDLWAGTTAVTVHVDGIQRFDGRTPCVLVANAPLGAGRTLLVPGAAPDDGLLDLVVVAPRWPLQRLRSLWRLLLGRPQDRRDLLRVQGEWVAVQLWDRREIELDGEPRPRSSRVDARVWPDALAVRVPPPGMEAVAGPDTVPEPDAVSELGPDAVSGPGLDTGLAAGSGNGSGERGVEAAVDRDAPPSSSRAGAEGASTN